MYSQNTLNTMMIVVNSKRQLPVLLPPAQQMIGAIIRANDHQQYNDILLHPFGKIKDIELKYVV